MGFSASRCGEAAAFGEFEREIRAVFVLADGVDGDDVRMAQPGDGVGLGPESVELIGRGVLALGDHLDRHDPAELLVAGLVDDAHTAAAQQLEDLVAVDRLERLVRLARSTELVRSAIAAVGVIAASTPNWSMSDSARSGNRA